MASVGLAPLRITIFTAALELRLAPRRRDIGLMEAKEAIAEGRYCVEQALLMLRRYL